MAGNPPPAGYGEIDRAATAALRRLGPGPPARTLAFPELNLGGRLVELGAVNDPARWLRLASGRLPRSCVPARCEVVEARGTPVSSVSEPGLRLVVVGHTAGPPPLGLAPLSAAPTRRTAAAGADRGRRPAALRPARLLGPLPRLRVDDADRSGALHDWQIGGLLDREAAAERSVRRARRSAWARRTRSALHEPTQSRRAGCSSWAAARRRPLLGFVLLAAAGLRRDAGPSGPGSSATAPAPGSCGRSPGRGGLDHRSSGRPARSWPRPGSRIAAGRAGWARRPCCGTPLGPRHHRHPARAWAGAAVLVAGERTAGDRPAGGPGARSRPRALASPARRRSPPPAAAPARPRSRPAPTRCSPCCPASSPSAGARDRAPGRAAAAPGRTRAPARAAQRAARARVARPPGRPPDPGGRVPGRRDRPRRVRGRLPHHPRPGRARPGRLPGAARLHRVGRPGAAAAARRRPGGRLPPARPAHAGGAGVPQRRDRPRTGAARPGHRARRPGGRDRGHPQLALRLRRCRAGGRGGAAPAARRRRCEVPTCRPRRTASSLR